MATILKAVLMRNVSLLELRFILLPLPLLYQALYQTTLVASENHLH